MMSQLKSWFVNCQQSRAVPAEREPQDLARASKIVIALGALDADMICWKQVGRLLVLAAGWK